MGGDKQQLQRTVTRTVRALMAVRGIRQKDLAERLGRTESDITYRMKGRWQLDELLPLGEALGVKPWNLLQEVDMAALAEMIGVEPEEMLRDADLTALGKTLGVTPLDLLRDLGELVAAVPSKRLAAVGTRGDGDDASGGISDKVRLTYSAANSDVFIPSQVARAA